MIYLQIQNLDDCTIWWRFNEKERKTKEEINSPAGIEPTTLGAWVVCSTTEVKTKSCFVPNWVHLPKTTRDERACMKVCINEKKNVYNILSVHGIQTSANAVVQINHL